MNSFEKLAVGSYDIIIFACAIFLMVVLRQAMNDLHLSRNESPMLIAARTRAFGMAAYFAVMTVYFQDYWLIHPSIIAVAAIIAGLLLGCIHIMIVNMASFRARKPRNPNTGFSQDDVFQPHQQLRLPGPVAQSLRRRHPE